MSKTVNFTTTADSFDVIINGVNQGTWDRTEEIDSEFTLKVSDTQLIMALQNPFYGNTIYSTDTIQKDGVAVTGTFREKIATLKDDVFFLPAASGGGASYLVYTALLTQTGTDAPVATVLENTLGGTVVWTRMGMGNYLATLNGVFIDGKTYISGAGNFNGTGNALIPVWNGNAITGYLNIYRSNNDSILFECYDNTYNSIEYSTLMGITVFNLPKIEVYP